MIFDRICNNCGAEFSENLPVKEGYNATYTCPRCGGKDSSFIADPVGENDWEFTE